LKMLWIYSTKKSTWRKPPWRKGSKFYLSDNESEWMGHHCARKTWPAQYWIFSIWWPYMRLIESIKGKLYAMEKLQ
jgi:hypothetical protein